MTVKVEWYLEDYVLHWHQSAEPRFEDLAKANERIIEHFTESPQKEVHVLMNLSKPRLNTMITSPLKLTQLFSFHLHPKRGILAIYGNSNAMFNTLVTILGSALGIKLHVFPSLAEAIRFLQMEDDQLLQLPLDTPHDTTEDAV